LIWLVVMLTRKSGRRDCLGVLVVAGAVRKKIVEGKGLYIGGGKFSVPPFVLSAASLSDKTEGKVINLRCSFAWRWKEQRHGITTRWRNRVTWRLNSGQRRNMEGTVGFFGVKWHEGMNTQ
jgi:hypothetical protein